MLYEVDLPLFNYSQQVSSETCLVVVLDMADPTKIQSSDGQAPAPIATSELDCAGGANGPSVESEPHVDTGDDAPSPAHLPATLAQALEVFEVTEKPAKDVFRHLRSDFAMVAKVTGCPLSDLPCAPVALRPILQKIRHARYNLSRGRWGTIKSSVARVLKVVGWIDASSTAFPPLAKDWAAATDVLKQNGQKAAFSAFARYCMNFQIPCSCVTLDVMQEYKAWRVERTLNLDIDHVTAIIRRIWIWLQKHHPEWPQASIDPMPNGRRESYFPEQFPDCFQAEVKKLIEDMAMFQPLDPRFKKKYSKYTIAGTRQTIFRAATTVAEKSGGTKVVMTIRDVVAPDRFRVVMMDHFERVGQNDTWAPSAKPFSIALKRVAKISGQLSPDELKELDKMSALVRAPKDGLSVTTRDRTAQFYDPEVMRKLTEFPDKLFNEADDLHKTGLLDRAARCHARGLQLAILIVNPLRRRTLACLDMNRHFKRDTKGRINRMLMPIGNSKNDKIVEGIVPGKLSDRIDRHIKVYRQAFLKNADSSFLFPGKNEGHVSPDTVARSIKRLVEDELGVDFNVHLVRHIVATMLLEADPRNMPLAQQMLGHRDCKTTERIYGHARGHAAQQAWNKTLETYHTKQQRVSPKRR